MGDSKSASGEQEMLRARIKNPRNPPKVVSPEALVLKEILWRVFLRRLSLETFFEIRKSSLRSEFEKTIRHIFFEKVILFLHLKLHKRSWKG
jgi:hypothetical protein